VVDELFSDPKGRFVFNFLDDLVVYSASKEEHLEHVKEVLSRLQAAGFTLNPEKVVLGVSEIKYLGHSLSNRGVRVLPDRVESIRKFPRPKNLQALERFMGMVGFYARFIPGYADVAAVLHALKKKGVLFAWQEEHQAAFEKLKDVLCKAPVLQIPDFDKQVVLATDASNVAISAVLQQRVRGQLAPVAYYSRVLTDAEKK
jgi:hypothetical protein